MVAASGVPSHSAQEVENLGPRSDNIRRSDLYTNLQTLPISIAFISVLTTMFLLLPADLLNNVFNFRCV